MRLKGKGIPGNPPGDMHAVLKIELPPADSDKAKEIYQLMERAVRFEPRTRAPQWRFTATTVVRVQKARRLQNDLGVNLPGVALALQLLDRIDALEARVRAASLRPDIDDAD
jgi:hypothetical protein